MKSFRHTGGAGKCSACGQEAEVLWSLFVNGKPWVEKVCPQCALQKSKEDTNAS